MHRLEHPRAELQKSGKIRDSAEYPTAGIPENETSGAVEEQEARRRTNDCPDADCPGPARGSTEGGAAPGRRSTVGTGVWRLLRMYRSIQIPKLYSLNDLKKL